MRKFKEVLRLKYEHELTNRKIAKSCAMSHVTVGKYLTLAEKAGIAWPVPDDIDDGDLERRLYQKVERPAAQKPAMPPMEQLFKELKRKHVTLQLLWYEYKQGSPQGFIICDCMHPGPARFSQPGMQGTHARVIQSG